MAIRKIRPPTATENPSAPGPDARLLHLGHGKFAIVDLDDYNRLNRYRWFLKKSRSNVYVVRRVRSAGKDRLIRLHREVMACPPHLFVHHNHANTLDCRKAQLTNCTRLDHDRLQKWIQTQGDPHHTV